MTSPSLLLSSFPRDFGKIHINITRKYKTIIKLSQDTVAFRPSEAAQERVRTLLYKEKNAELTDEEKTEFDHYMYIEHLMRLAKIRARQLLQN